MHVKTPVTAELLYQLAKTGKIGMSAADKKKEVKKKKEEEKTREKEKLKMSNKTDDPFDAHNFDITIDLEVIH